TTCADAGTVGPASFERFLKGVIEPSRSRIFAFINIAAPGMTEAEQDPRTYDVQLSVDVAKRYPEHIVGHKIAHYWTGTQPYDSLHTPWANVDALMEAGRKTGLPVMIDWFPRPASQGYPARTYRELILEKTRPGDIHTHNYARHIPVLDMNEKGKVNPDIFKAQERGFKFDTGHGSGSFVWRNAVPAVEQGFISDSISSDLHNGSVKGAMLDMPNIMSKYLCMGVPLEDVVRRSTVNPARQINHSELGTLSTGSSADIAVLELEKGKFNFLDTSGGRLIGDRKLRNLLTVFKGRIEFDPTGLSYPVWEDVPKDNDYWVNQSGQFF
ncbi:MAG: amidohydrolase family protein, partial [Candidatus Latescibacteria bacterium]|nr:amidohydrolase family protein [Candidatus Latescibacterota bacterium]